MGRVRRGATIRGTAFVGSLAAGHPLRRRFVGRALAAEAWPRMIAGHDAGCLKRECHRLHAVALAARVIVWLGLSPAHEYPTTGTLSRRCAPWDSTVPAGRLAAVRLPKGLNLGTYSPVIECSGPNPGYRPAAGRTTLMMSLILTDINH